LSIVEPPSASDSPADEPTARWWRQRTLAFAGVLVLCIAGAAGYAIHAARRADDRAASVQPVTTIRIDALPAAAPEPYLLFRSTAVDDTHGRIAYEQLDANGAAQRFVTPLACERVHYAAGRGICLEAKRGALTSYHAHLFDWQLRRLHSFALAGPPSRARLSADGRLAATTVFVSGHSYASPGFTTRTSIIDVASGQHLVDDLEKIDLLRDGQPFKAADFNFWGVTFTRDAQRYYATLQTGGKLFLVEGDIAARRMRVIHDDVECPSLSPDGTKIAFKRRIAGAEKGRFVWRLHVLELASRRETALTAEARSVDDQVEWLGEREIAYALSDDSRGASAATDSWALAVDGASPPRLLARLAFSPTYVR
jgi:hypothetical protein